MMAQDMAHIPHEAGARGRKLRQRPLFWAGIAVPALLWTGLYAGAAAPLREPLARHASRALGREVMIGGPLRVLVTPFSVRLIAGDVRVANPGWARAPDLLRAARVTARFDMFDLMLGRPAWRGLDLRDGTLDLERSADGRQASWTTSAEGTLGDLTAIRAFTADGMAVHYRDPSRRNDTRFTLAEGRGGEVQVRGQGTAGTRRFAFAGTLRARDADLTHIALQARGDGLALGIEGRAESPFRLDRAPLTLDARGSDFARLAALAGIRLPAMPAYALSAELRGGPGLWRFRDIDGHIGRTDLDGQLLLDLRQPRPRLLAELASHALDMADMRALAGAREPPGDLIPDARRLLPDIPLDPAALRQMDARVTYLADSVTGVPHAPRHLTFQLALRDGVLRLSPASVDMDGGFISSDITIDGRRDVPMASYDIRLSPTPMGRLLASWGVAAQGTTATLRGRLQLSGPGHSVRETLAHAAGRIALVVPRGAMATQRASDDPLDMASLGNALFRDESATLADVNCGLIAFTVRGGIATADPILIDTSGNVLTGEGRIDLAGETIDVRLEAEGKRFALFGRPSPITLSGSFASPVVTRQSTSWFKPVSLFGFSFRLPSIAAIFDFVDPDDVKVPQCGPVLSGQPGAAQLFARAE